jgi:hypothetical protein
MLTSLSTISTCNSRQTWWRLVLGGFLLRALIPVGFMPAPLASGGPIMLCHGGLAGAFFQTLTESARNSAVLGYTADHSAINQHARPDHPAGTDEPTQEHSGWEHCPTGATASAAAMAHGFAFTLLALSHRQPDPKSQFGTQVPPISPYQARAPPPSLARLLA